MKIIVIFFILVCSIIKSYEENVDIRVLMKEPDMPSTINIDQWIDEYEELINKYFIEKNINNPKLNNIKFSFDFYPNTPANSSYNLEYYENYQYIVGSLMNETYDIMILDERVLFSEVAFLETEYFEYYMGHQRPSRDLLENLSKSIDIDKLSFHDPKTLKDGYIYDQLYALPYEIDYDLLYYIDNDSKTKKLVSEMKNLNWDDFVHTLKEEPQSNPLEISIAYDDDIINFYIEYISCYHNLSKEYDKNYYKVFYNETGEDLLNSFRELILYYTDDSPEDSLYIPQDDIFLDFINGKTTFFKGKASYNLIVSPVPDISSTLPPKYVSAKYKKYLVVNKSSQVDHDLLMDIAQELTSKDMQLYRAQHFGSIPTFDFSKVNEDSDIKSYCLNYPKICNDLKEMNPLFIRDIFNTKYSSSYFEVEYVVPDYIRIYMEENEMSYVIKVFKNIYELVTSNMGAYGVLSYIVISISSIFYFVLCFFIYKYKEHPYLKVVSPSFCICIVIGSIYEMFKILTDLPPYFIAKPKVYFIIDVIGVNLVYLPMFVVTYRIYRIFQSKSYLSKSLTDKRLFNIIVIIMVLTLIYKFIILFTSEFYYTTFGSITESRFPIWLFSNYKVYDILDDIYYYTIFFIILFMITTAGRNARKFGDIRYTYIIFIMNITQFITQSYIQKFSMENYPKRFFSTIIFLCLVYFLCIYILVGARVLFIMLVGSTLDMKSSSKYDLKEFVSLKSLGQYRKFINMIKESLSRMNLIKNNNNNDNNNNINNKNNLEDQMSIRSNIVSNGITSDISSMN
eukprot:jgi/Orpsp1_1/1186435/evm.model.d7180000050574.1